MPGLTNLAGVVIKKERGLLLLHRDFEGLEQWEMPGGKVEPGETPYEAAIREAREELGVDVEVVSHLGYTVFAKYRYDWFGANVTSGTPRPAEEMFDDLDYFNFERLISMGRCGLLSQNMEQFLKLLQNEEIIL